jgi:cation:H+ antiporter
MLILGIGAMLVPVACNPKAFYRDGAMLALSAAVLAVVVLIGHLGRASGVVFITLLLAYVVFTYLKESRSPDEAAALHEAEAALQLTKEPMGLPLALFLAIGGIALTVYGAMLLVDGASRSQPRPASRNPHRAHRGRGRHLPAGARDHRHRGFQGQGDVAMGTTSQQTSKHPGILGVCRPGAPARRAGRDHELDIWVMLAATVLLLLLRGQRLACRGARAPCWSGSTWPM